MRESADSRKGSTRARRGGAAIRLLVVALLFAAAVGGIALVIGRTDSTGAPLRGPPGEPTPSARHDTPLAPVPEARRTQQSADEPDDARGFAPERFQGSGRVRGEVSAAPGIVFPPAWTLVLEPHPWLEGSQRAITKRIEHARGERAFDSGEVPLAGYRVRAEAPGLNSTEAQVLLVKGSHDQFVTIELRPAGLIDGRVFDADGAPADGLDVWLESQATQVRAHTTVGAGGVFRFDDVIDGQYRLWFGAPEVPLITPVDLEFRAPTLRIADRTLPPTGALEIVTVDERGLPVGDVEVTGSGAPRGSLRVTTGAHGRASARWLMPGSYRLDARSADGRVAREAFEVTAGETTNARLRLRLP